MKLFSNLTTRFKGYTVIELLLTIALISLLLTGLLNIVLVSNNFAKDLENSYENQLKLQYGLDFMINEIDSADYIIERNLPKTIGILLVKFDENKKKEKYSITTYIFKQKQILRLNQKREVLQNNISLNDFKGGNVLIDSIESFNSVYNSDSKILTLSISNDIEEINIKHYIRGVIYEDF